MKTYYTKHFVLIYLLSFLSIITIAQPGNNDDSFNSLDIGYGNDIATGGGASLLTSLMLNNGKILIGGNFGTYNGRIRNCIAQINIDGSLDTTFNPGTGAAITTGGSGAVNTISIQNDGKYIVGGFFGPFNGITKNSIVRLNPDGSVDNSFNTGTGTISINGVARIYSTAIQSDGKIIVGGDFSFFNGVARNGLVRLNVDGSIDGTFNIGTGAADTRSICIQGDGKIVIGGRFLSASGVGRNRIARLNSNGSNDNSFLPTLGADNDIYHVNIQTDGKVIVGGIFTTLNGLSRNRIGRLNTNGSIDFTFNPGTGFNSSVETTKLQSDGKIIIGGFFTSFNNAVTNRISRLNTDGSLDMSFNTGTGFNSPVTSILFQTDGKLIIVGGFSICDGLRKWQIARLNANGDLDKTYLPYTGTNSYVFDTETQTDGKIIIAGQFTTYNDVIRYQIARLNADGTLDLTFTPPTMPFVFTPMAMVVKIQSDGKIIIGGFGLDYNGLGPKSIVRLNSDGSVDNTFNPVINDFSAVRAISLQNDGKIIIGGSFYEVNGTSRNNIARLEVDGSLDLSFNPGSGTNNSVYTTAIQTDGKIIIGGGRILSYNGETSNSVVRLNIDGSRDNSFNAGTGVDFDYDEGQTVLASVIQDDGKIIVGGQFYTFNGIARGSIARLNSDGSIDASFDPGTGVSGSVNSIAMPGNGKILIAGGFTSYNNSSINGIARIFANGSIDPSFSPGLGPIRFYYFNYIGSINVCEVQNDGKIMVGGSFGVFDSTGRNNVCRLLGDNSIAINLFIQGFYISNRTMQSTLFDLGESNDPLATDTLTINFCQPSTPYAIVYSTKSILNKYGQTVITIPDLLMGNSYFIALKHRNSIETWSSNPVTINSGITYDFTSAQSNAWGSNMTDVGTPYGEPPVWAIYSGDISDALSGIGYQDGVIESQDYSDMENAIGEILTGYIFEDITGDGVVESSDYSLVENNLSNLVYSMHP